MRKTRVAILALGCALGGCDTTGLKINLLRGLERDRAGRPEQFADDRRRV